MLAFTCGRECCLHGRERLGECPNDLTQNHVSHLQNDGFVQTIVPWGIADKQSQPVAYGVDTRDPLVVQALDWPDILQEDIVLCHGVDLSQVVENVREEVFGVIGREETCAGSCFDACNED